MIETVQGFVTRSSPAIISGLVVFICTQAIVGLIWAAQLGTRINTIELQIKTHQAILERFDEHGTRAMAVVRLTQDRGAAQLEVLIKRLDALDARAHEYNVTVTREGTMLRASVDGLKQDVNRLQEQQNKILHAIDNALNLINEHLRGHSQPR